MASKKPRALPSDLDYTSAWDREIDAYCALHAPTKAQHPHGTLECWRLIRTLSVHDDDLDPTTAAGRVMRYPGARTVTQALTFLCEKAILPNIAATGAIASDGTRRKLNLDLPRFAKNTGLEPKSLLKALRMMQRHKAVHSFRRKHGVLWIDCDLRVLDAFTYLSKLDGLMIRISPESIAEYRAASGCYANEMAVFDPAESTLPKWSPEI